VDALPIASVERETGLSKDTLRVWERRYGFPVPARDDRGERLYPPGQVQRLAQIKRLMDRGHRPGKLLALDPAELAALDSVRPATQPAAEAGQLDAWMRLVETHDHEAMQQLFHRELIRRGMASFVQDIVAPLITRVGEAWSRNQIGVFEEHLFSRQLEQFFRGTLAGVAVVEGQPRILLTTLSGEEHTLGLLMVEALLTLQDAYTVTLGPQTPIAEIVRAATAKQVDVVCLSFSSAYPSGQAQQGLADLRRALPAHVGIWAGGAGVKGIRKPMAGVSLVPDLGDLLARLAAANRSRPA